MAEQFVVESELADDSESGTELDDRMDKQNNESLPSDDLNKLPLIESAGLDSEWSESECDLGEEAMPSLVAYEPCSNGSGSDRDTSQSQMFHCEACQHNFASNYHLKRHLSTLTHLQKEALTSTPPPLSCVLSRVSTVEGESDTDVLHNCLVCDRVYSSASALKRHSSTPLHQHNLTMTSMTPVEAEKLKEAKMEAKVIYHCEVCDHTYGTSNHLKRHFATLMHKNNATKPASTTVHTHEVEVEVNKVTEAAAIKRKSDTTAEVNEELVKRKTSDTTAEVTEELVKKTKSDTTVELNEEVVKRRKSQNTAEVTEELSNDVTVELPNDVTLELVNDVIVELCNDVTKEAVVKKVADEELEWFKCKYCSRVFLCKEIAIEHCQTHLVEKEEDSSEESDEEEPELLADEDPLLEEERDEDLAVEEAKQNSSEDVFDVLGKVKVGGEDFVEDSEFVVVVKMLEEEDMEWFKCKYCPRIFTCKSTAVEHCQTHLEDSSSTSESEYESEGEGEGGDSARDADDENSS